VNVTEKSEEVGVLLTCGGNFSSDFKSLIVLTFAKVGVGQIELHVVRLGIGLQGGLKMRNGVVVEAIPGKQHTYSGLGAEVAGCLSDRVERLCCVRRPPSQL